MSAKDRQMREAPDRNEISKDKHKGKSQYCTDLEA